MNKECLQLKKNSRRKRFRRKIRDRRKMNCSTDRFMSLPRTRTDGNGGQVKVNELIDLSFICLLSLSS